MLSGCAIPCLRAVASTKPAMRAMAGTGVCSSPKLMARRNMVSESVEPSSEVKSCGSMAMSRSRLTRGKSSIMPLCMNIQRRWRNGWQLVSCTGVCVAARTCAETWAPTRRATARAGCARARPAGCSDSERACRAGAGTSPVRSHRHWSSSLQISNAGFGRSANGVRGTALFPGNRIAGIGQPTTHGALLVDMEPRIHPIGTRHHRGNTGFADF